MLLFDCTNNHEKMVIIFFFTLITLKMIYYFKNSLLFLRVGKMKIVEKVYKKNHVDNTANFASCLSNLSFYS